MRKIIKELKKVIFIKINEINLKLKNSRYQIKTTKETIEKIKKGYSISRYGDGEFEIILKKKSIRFQTYNSELQKDLESILKSNLANHLVAIPRTLVEIKNLTKEEKGFWSRYYLKNRKNLDKKLIKEKLYYDSMVSRFYMPYIDKTIYLNEIEELINFFKSKNLLIVEGEYTRFGIGNNLLKEVKNIKRIILPAKDSYIKMEHVFNYILENIGKEYLILLALGPTATVLAYKLCEQGYQALDIGHLDVEYEWSRMRATEKVDILYKSVNEVSGVTKKEIDDKKLEKIYLNQIIKKFL